ncbi:MAG: hypothetical protein CM1200mP3_18890 [Chloroflexota bacterium]|nr:MAG: hypothetical protein CM1200mP3_18890 [Chloroflexota bacterium]
MGGKGKLGRPTAHRMLMLRGMATGFLKHERIETTDIKAKEVRKLAEKVVTLGKKEGFIIEEKHLQFSLMRLLLKRYLMT